jgi:alkylhydroperoxidase/carboxymuconolactone decarboxylase family protein YurZ
VDDYTDILRRLSIRDDAYVEALLADDQSNVEASGFDRKTHALVQLAALVAVDPAPPSYMRLIDVALECNASRDEIVGTLIAAMPAVGTARVVSAAPKLALALGYDVASALEELDDDRRRR